MLKLDLSNLLFNKSFLDLKYKTKRLEAIKNINKKYTSGKLDFLNVDKIVDTKKINSFVEKNKENFESVVVLGIGGSALGAKAIMQSLKGKYYNELTKEKRRHYPKLYILDNIDPEEINNLIEIINLKKTLFIVISKSGSTIETISQFSFFKKMILEKKLDIKKHFVIVAGENSYFKKKSLKEGFVVFDIPENIGGRFSVFTSVGLLPLAFIGVNIDLLLKGVSNIKNDLLLDDSLKNQSLLSSMINYHAYRELGKNILVLFPYSTNLFYFGEWYKQILAESLGKGGLGITPNTAIGVTDQHSQLQLYYDGPNDKIVNFIEIKNSKIDYIICRDKRFTFKNLLDTEKYGTQKSITDYNKINYTLTIDRLDEETIGELIIFYEMQIAIMAEFFGVNAFDQPGVEIGKNITKEKLRENIGKIEILEKNSTKNLVFIGGGNGQSSILKNFKEQVKKKGNTLNTKFNISSIVAMSDDGRTTGMLMRSFKEELGLHLPPPGDLRRILFTLSKSNFKDYFSIIFNQVFRIDESIEKYSLKELFEIISNELSKEGKLEDLKAFVQDYLNKKGEIYKKVTGIGNTILYFKLPLKASLKGHKFGNILMASLYYNFDKDYEKMIEFMKEFLEVEDEVLPVTINEATIKAILKDGTIIKTQDKISNVADYNSPITQINFLDKLAGIKITDNIKNTIKNADYIIIGPGDLFTSIIANFIVDGLTQEIEKSDAKIIYVLNANNKKGETTNYKIGDFLKVINKYLGTRKIDYLIGNNKIPELTEEQKEIFKNDISVKGGDYLLLSNYCLTQLKKEYKNLNFIIGEYIYPKDLYKYNEKLIDDLIGVLK